MANKPTKRLHHKNLNLNHKNFLLIQKRVEKGRAREHRTDEKIEKLQHTPNHFNENVLSTLIKETVVLDKKSKT